MTRTFAMGDPQAPFAKVLDVLDRHGALAGDRLADDVVLVSIGDHFDYDQRDPVSAGREGLQLLRWLASHDRAQVRIVLGNHDAARVMELGAWATEAARARPHGGIRTLHVSGDRVVYDLEVGADPLVALGGWAGGDGAAEMIFIDGELRRVSASEVALLPLLRV